MDLIHRCDCLSCFLQIFISEQSIPSRSGETVPEAWVEISHQHQRSHAGEETLCMTQGETLRQIIKRPAEIS